MKAISKTVTVRGESTKVMFERVHVSRDVNTNDYKENTFTYIINGNPFTIHCVSKRGRSGKFNKSLFYDGIKFPDSEKKVIEYILSK